MNREELQRRTEAAGVKIEEAERKKAEEEAERKWQDELRQKQQLLQRCQGLIEDTKQGMIEAADRGASSYTNDHFPDYDPMFREAIEECFPDLVAKYKVVMDKICDWERDGLKQYKYHDRTILTISW